MSENSTPLKKGLYIVPTPIGNLADITLRALEILKNSNYILCEDTRVSKKLLDKYRISSKLISNHKFNEKKNLSRILGLLKKGAIISLISDAGTPGVSDPGFILIKECLKNDIKIIPLPGASAVSSAISISGFSEKFFFYGFFPDKLKIINDDLESLSNINSSIVFFISPKKLNKAIPFIKKNFTGRNILICREMTKLYEEFFRCSVDDLKEFNREFKGELTIVISEKNEKKKASQELSESDKRNIKSMINKLSIKEITALPYFNNKVSKKKIYSYCLKLKNES
ncbi:16S rRNA (cytidine(1402)-2'-O)-methyltransferase [Candidatus Pelagibacter sp.]|nr:16S rRNA (cytidine(1402)-2'-O)-methyltransferase [Candidatus Pelagibacter sp.]